LDTTRLQVGRNRRSWISTARLFRALNSDANYTLVGGYSDNGNIGATWVFTRNGTTWTQQGSKLVGTGGVGQQLQGFSVALNSDATYALVGGHGDNSGIGAAWVFNRNATGWFQQNSKLVGTGGSVSPQQGYSVALNSDATYALVGGIFANSYKGAAWVFMRSSSSFSEMTWGPTASPTLSTALPTRSPTVHNSAPALAGGVVGGLAGAILLMIAV
jgi:uncharacterized protein YneR